MTRGLILGRRALEDGSKESPDKKIIALLEQNYRQAEFEKREMSNEASYFVKNISKDFEVVSQRLDAENVVAQNAINAELNSRREGHEHKQQLKIKMEGLMEGLRSSCLEHVAHNTQKVANLEARTFKAHSIMQKAENTLREEMICNVEGVEAAHAKTRQDLLST